MDIYARILEERESKKLIQLATSPYNPKMYVKDRRYHYILNKAPIWNMDDVNHYMDQINTTITENLLTIYQMKRLIRGI